MIPWLHEYTFHWGKFASFHVAVDIRVRMGTMATVVCGDCNRALSSFYHLFSDSFGQIILGNSLSFSAKGKKCDGKFLIFWFSSLFFRLVETKQLPPADTMMTWSVVESGIKILRKLNLILFGSEIWIEFFFSMKFCALVSSFLRKPVSVAFVVIITLDKCFAQNFI